MKTRMLAGLFFATSLLAGAIVLTGPVPLLAQAPVALTGAGSTFVFPAMARWADDYKKAHGTSINYQSVGSGAGIKNVQAGTVDFGASDAVIGDVDLKGHAPLLQIPESAGPVCITYNLPALQKPLRLTSAALAGIFLGTIESWDDAAIAQANPGVRLPKMPVLVAHRSDGSGTTAIFTAYLAAVQPQWKARYGAGPIVNWPVGLGGKGSEGVTGIVKQTAGAIGYVELTYANTNHLPVAQMQNAAGAFVAPSAAATAAAIEAFKVELAKDLRAPIVNAPGARVYPIAGLTYFILPKDGPDVAKRQALKDFVKYVVTSGQATATALNYAPLPAALVALDQKMLREMTANGKPLQ